MNFPTKEQIELMEEPEVTKQLKLLAKTYKLDKPIQEYMTPELWEQLEDIVNTLLWLEDRQHWLKHYEHLRGENKV